LYSTRPAKRVIAPHRQKKIDSVVFGSQCAIIAVEQRWKERIAACTLYQYEFSPRNFYPIDYCAGYYISEQAEVPIAIH